jgi:signal transduction histidine kinase
VAKINVAAGMLMRLIEDMLDLSRVKLGRSEVLHGAGDAAALARQAADAAGIPPDGVGLTIDAPEGELPIETDIEKATKILQNLISNALKFTPAGAVTVSIRPVEDGGVRVVEWEVRDTGIGIAPEQLDAIFDEFRQVDGSSTRLYGGTGLGLALSRRLAELLGGSIQVESEPGRGSTFTLRLPARMSLSS